MAFAIAANQNKQLLGKNGLLPSDLYLERIESHFSDTGWRKILHVPTVLLYTDKSRIEEHYFGSTSVYWDVFSRSCCGLWMCEHVYHDITLGVIPFYCQHWTEVVSVYN